MQQHNASISGGSDKTTYYGSIGYKGQDGILQYGTDKYKRINMSFNFSTQITKWLEVTFRTKYNRNTSDYPYTSNFNLGNIFTKSIVDSQLFLFTYQMVIILQV